MFEAYHHGLDVLGARGATLGPRGRVEVFGARTKQTIAGDDVRGWDNYASYSAGDGVYHNGRYWRAQRDVSPPFMPTIMDGDVPGKSDAWREITAEQAYSKMEHVLGAVSDVLGSAYPAWDKSQAWSKGQIVTYWGDWWRAKRDIEPPWFPLAAGDVPGESDAWEEAPTSEIVLGASDGMTHSERYAIGLLDDVYIGMEDIQSRQRQMDNLKPVTLGIAAVLLRYGLQAINKAITGAKQPWYRADLPGDTARQECLGHLKWHADKLTSLQAGGDQNKLYDSADDLKKWVMQAFIEQNAVEEGAAAAAVTWSKAWDDYKTMWSEIAVELAKLPKAIVQAAAKLPGQIFEGVTGIPSWVFWVGIAAGSVLTFWVIYKLITGPVGAAVAGTVTRRYLP